MHPLESLLFLSALGLTHLELCLQMLFLHLQTHTALSLNRYRNIASVFEGLFTYFISSSSFVYFIFLHVSKTFNV